MKNLLSPVQLNETSSRVQLLHIALAALGMPVAETERLEKRAGETTLKSVRAIQSQLGVKVDQKVLADAITVAAFEKELRSRGILEDNSIFTAAGKVLTSTGEIVSRAKLLAFDLDLKGAGIYRKAKTLEEITKNGGFELLSEAESVKDGSYSFSFSYDQFKNAERKEADIVVFAIEQNNIIGRSRIVHAEDYSDTGEVSSLDVIVQKTDARSEYEKIMTELMRFLAESRVSINELSGSKDQISFTASELDLPEKSINIIADAQKLVQVEQKLSHELLYALGRGNFALTWTSLYNKKEEDMRVAISNAMTANIIRKQEPKEIDAFIQLLIRTASAFALDQENKTEKVSIDSVLSNALPEKQQRVAFLQATRSFQGDPFEFWTKYLPSLPEFQNKPELIQNILYTHQLTMITGNHQPLVTELQKKYKQNDPAQLLTISSEEWIQLFKTTGIPEGMPGNEDNEKANNYAALIQNVLNATYPTQKIGLMIKSKEIEFKDEAISTGIQNFINDNKNFNIGSSRIYEFEKEIEKAAPKGKIELKQELLRMQRIFQVSATPTAMKTLMENNLDSAYAIANTPQKSFIKMYGPALGGDDIATAVYQKASYVNTRAEMNAMKMMEMSHGVTPEFAMDKLGHEKAMAALQNEVPNYSNLFGSPDICEVDHCQSVYGPAAYYVDLLRFLWRGTKNHNNKSPLDMLAKRRPDLLFLPLTCENTDTLIPYIDLVNEVMEFYTVNGSLNSFEGYDTGESTAEELRADPQNFNIEAYRKLKDNSYPFTLPYHQPLDVIRTYGDHLKTARQDVMKAMNQSSTQASQRAIESETINISPEEYKILTKEDFSGAADATALHTYFGFNNAGQLELMAGVREFIKRSGIEYTDLVELVKTKFINPTQNVFDFLQDLFTDSTLDASEIYSRLQQIKNSTLDPATDTAIMASLTAANITAGDFVNYVQNNFDNFNAVITLYEPNSQCELDTTCLRTLQNVYAAVTTSGITNVTWSKIHRFIRLWRKLGWSIHETDLILTAIGQSDITPSTISKLSALYELNLLLKRPLNQLAAIWGSIDTYGSKSLYKKLFLNKTVLNLDSAFKADAWSNYLNDPAAKLVDHIPAILAAFRMSQEDLDAILAIAEINDNGNARLLDLNTDLLNISNLSIIYRYTILSKALKFKVPDFCLLLSLFDANPFSTWNVQLQQFENISTSATLECYQLATDIKAHGFKPVDLQYIFTGALPVDSNLGLNADKIRQTAKTIRDTFTTIDQDHPDKAPVPLTADILRSKLTLTFQPDVVNQFLAILDGTSNFSVITDNNLGISIPSLLVAKYAYVNASGRLTCTGVMTDAERTTLKALSGNSNFQASVDELYALPEEFLNDTFSGVFSNINTAIATLLNHPAQLTPATIEEKFLFVYNSYLPLLKQKLREDAIAQHIAALTGLSEDASRIIVRSDMPSLVGDLAKQGFSGQYFNDTTWSTLSLERVDSEINFDWAADSPDAAVAANNFSSRWESYLTPPASGEYTIILEVNEADEAFKLYLDDALILEKASGNTLLSWEILASLNASKMHKLKLEYAETTGAAGIRLYWKTAGTGATIVPASATFPAKIIDAFVTTATVYHRAAKFISGFKLNEVEVDHFVSYSVDFANIDFKSITATHWKRISDYVLLTKSIPQAQATLVDVFKAANTTNPVPAINDLRDLLYLATAWDPISLDYLINTHFTLALTDFKNEIAIARLYDSLSIITRTGISATTVAIWGAVETDFDALNETSQLIKSMVKAKYEEEDWMEIAPRLSDAIRENQKLSLISYLLMQPSLQSWGVEDADGLFEYFLLDVQMGACMDTSRIVQDTATVQMFVNRCLLNLESDLTSGNQTGVAPDAVDTDRWEWMKNYRVWEANRKVFLYPENWLEPEWRDDRSPFFKDLESELVQNDITDRSVETAFRNYLSKLNEVANLEICGMCQENDDSGKLKLLHVFGRTHNAPYQVYYRTWDNYMKWTAWDKVNADVRNVENNDKSGVHLLPTVWKNRLFLFWAEFIEKKESPTSARDKNAKDASESGTLGGLEPRVYFEVRLAWTEYADGKWTPKQLSKEFFTQYTGTVVKDLSSIRLISDINSSTNVLTIYTTCEFDGGWVELGSFTLTDITSKIEAQKVSNSSTHTFEDKWYGYSLSFMKFKQKSALKLLDDDYLKESVNHKLLVSPTRTNYVPRLTDPFFYSDHTRTYFVRPVTIRVISQIKEPEKYLPFIPNIIDDSYYTDPIHIPKYGPDDYMPPSELFTEPMVNFAGIHTTQLTKEFADSGTMVANRVITNGLAKSNGSNLNSGLNPIMASTNGSNVINKDAVTSMDFVTEMNSYKYLGESFLGVSQVGIGILGGDYRMDKGLEFHTFYHPHSNKYVTRLNRKGIPELMKSDTAIASDNGNTFINKYDPNFANGFVQKPSDFPTRTYFKENVCFDVYGANSIYNWELFFHAPLYIATRLSKNGKFEESLKWFHYIFDPTTDAMPGAGETEISRYWKVLPFKTTPVEDLEDWFLALSPNTNPSTENLIIGEWRDNPFMPHLVARNRPLAYMKNVVIKYVETLLEWGDTLFRQFTRESVNEALQIYVIANHILGPKPQFVPRRGDIKAESYNTLKDKLDDFSNAIVQLENLFPYSSSIPVSDESTGSNLLGIGPSLYFGIPANDKLMEYWDTAADRLYKIRHCMDIDGVERKLALFAPPIDPAALIQAAAQGLSLGSILADLSSPPPIYRFNFLIQKANEFCAEVKVLGSALLTALEKKDAEELGRLRSTHERSMLELIKAVKERQVLEARTNREMLGKMRDTAQFRLQHYNDLLGVEDVTIPGEPTIPALLTADSTLPSDTSIPVLATDVDESLVDSDESGVKLIPREKQELDLGYIGALSQVVATGIEAIAGSMNFIPTFSAEIEPFGCGASMSFGGSNIAGGMSGIAKVPAGLAQYLQYMATTSAKMASYIRREQDWTLQANLASREIIQLDKQITAGDIRVQIAEKDLENHEKQIENAQAVELFLQDKFTNQELYQWMKEQLFAVYKQSYNLCYDMAKKAEKAYKYEIGNELASFIQYGYWDNSYQGLLAGEKLQMALRQLEKSYLEQNKRELELRKNISLAIVNPLALQELKQTGKCFVKLPEELFDLDFQGHFFRRIKSVSLSIPCIAGPLTTISCTLRLIKNSVRINTTMNDEGNYEHMNDEGLWTDDDRFRDSNVPVQSIASSTGQNDAGLFELNFRDERYLPFEGAGAISDWKIELTADKDLRQFDYNTISDVIFHMNYTAREDAGLFKQKAVDYIKTYLTNAAELSKQPLMRMFSLRHEFPSEWYRFLNPIAPDADQVMNVTLKKEHFPFFTRERNVDVMQFDILIDSNRSGDYHLIFSATDNSDAVMTSTQISVPENATYGQMKKATLTGTASNISVEDINAFAATSLKFKHNTDSNYHSIDADPAELRDVFIVIHYKLSD